VTSRQVRDALARLHDLAYLQTQPRAAHVGGGRALQRTLLRAIEAMHSVAAARRGSLVRSR